MCGDGYFGSAGGCQTYYLGPGIGEWEAFSGPPASNPGSIFITMGISSAGIGSIPIPDFGHLYVQEWYGNWPAMAPIGTILQAGSVSGKLEFAAFSQHPLTDWQAFLLDANQQASTALFPGYWYDLVATKNIYQSQLSIAPSYSPASMNSNSWAYGLAIYSNAFPAINVQQSIYTDQELSELDPEGWANGASLSKNFL